MELVSIIIPVYNREEMIVEAIKSCLNQTYNNIEIIVVNDGSTDNTLEIVKVLQEQNKKIRVINQENKGVSQARITGFNHSNGEYVMFLDSDDLISKNYVANLVSTLKETHTSVSLARRYQEIGFLRILYNKYPNYMDLRKDKCYLPTFWVGVNCKLYERRNLELLDFGLKANEDLAFNYYDMAQKRYVSCNNKAIYTQRLADNSLAKDLIYGNLDHIDYTLIPLEIEKRLFSENCLISEFREELEAIFIKNIFERICNIYMSKIAKEKKDELVICLLKCLNFHFPYWAANKYYNKNFKGFPIDSKLYVNIASLFARKVATNEVNDSYKRLMILITF